MGQICSKKINLIDKKQNKILSAPHPSPLLHIEGFLDASIFQEINKILKEWLK